MAGSVVALQEVNEDEKEPLAGALDQYSLPPPKIYGLFSWLPSWRPSSTSHLAIAERNLLHCLQTSYTDLYVPIGKYTVIRTITMEPDTPSSDIPRHPLVMVHGFGCGLGAFYKNYDCLHSKRRLFAFDVLGFGRSSRTSFSTEPEKVEDEFVESFERWREALGLEKIILLGHSLGGFMCTIYAMKYPERIQHLILVDSWGFVRKPEKLPGSLPLSWKIFFYLSFFCNPFMVLRALGPAGPHVIGHSRPDLVEVLGEIFLNYCYHCNAQDPTGETAFFHLKLPIAWAKRPLEERLDSLDPSVPMTLIHGTQPSLIIDSNPQTIYALRSNSYVKVCYIKDASHQVHMNFPELFNEIVNCVCDASDEGRDIGKKPQHTIFNSQEKCSVY